MTVQPRLHISEAVVAPVSSITSGAIQYGVPTTLDSLRPVVRLATPKSASFTRPSLVVRIFAPLISRCITPCSCRYKRPWRTWDIYRPTRFSGKRPKFFAIECKEPFSQYLDSQQPVYLLNSMTYSRMMLRVSTLFTNPWYFTMLACWILGQRLEPDLI